MNLRLRPFSIALLMLTLSLLLGLTVTAQEADGVRLRFVHAIFGASAIDVYVNEQLTVANLADGEATAYINAPAGELRIMATQTGVTTPLWQQTVTPGTGNAYTLVVSSFADPIAFTVFEDILDPLELGKARFTAIHAIPQVDPIDIILADGRPMLPQITYNQAAGTLDIPTFPYAIAVVPSGGAVEDALVTLDPLPLNTGTSYMLVVHGTAASPRALLLSTAVNADPTATAAVRLVHGVPGAPSVDVYVNDVLAATLTEPAGGFNTTPYISVPPGSYGVDIRATGTDESLLAAELSVEDGDNATVIAVGTPDELSLSVIGDDLTGITSDLSSIRVINATAGLASVSLEDGTVLAVDVPAGEASFIAAVTPVTSGLVITSDEQDSTLEPINFYGGALYDVLVLPDTTEVLPPVAVAQTLASAPGAASVVAIAATPTETPALEATSIATEVIEVTPTSDPNVATADPNVVQATLPPVPTQAPAIAPTPGLPIGRVFNLNPDANLQLRQYPNSLALSLGTASNGTEFSVNGREGELADIPLSSTRIPPDYEYIDPVGLLVGENEDLAREATWLNITFNTPDGGQIDAWVRSDYVDVRNAEGEQIRLRDLPPIPGNLPGESRNTAITSPSARQNIASALVVNLNAGTNLNVRRTPNVEAEVLVQIPLGGVAEIQGISSDRLWLFLDYTAPDGSRTTGWGNIEFLSYQLNGAPTTEDELELRGLLNVIPADRIGQQLAGASVAVAAATQEIARNTIVAVVELNPGANLNMRRAPNVDAEVLAQIPAGSRLPVTVRTGDARWLSVTFDGVEGWIAARTDTAQFVRLTFNDQPFELNSVPIADGEIDSTLFTATPTVLAPPPAAPTLTPTPAS